MARPASRFGYLDSLRFIAATVVVWQHLTDHRGDFLGRTVAQVGLGHAGVVIFFCISGFVVPLSVGGRMNFASFMVRRMFRLYPLYLAALALLLVVGGSGLLPQWAFLWSAPPRDWIANLLLVQDFAGARPFLGVSWTLIIEIMWYTLFGLSVTLFGKRAGDILDIVMPASLLALAAASLLLESRIPLGRPMMLYATVFGYQCYRHATGETDLRRFLLSIAVFLTTVLICTYVGFAVFQHAVMSFAQTLGPWLGGIATFLAIVFWPRLRDAPVFNAGWLPLLGTFSYSIYLLHPIAINAATHYFEGPLRMPIAVLLLVPLAWAGFRFVETPAIGMGRVWGRRIDARSAPVT
ncbi:hypothetical protein IP88_03385 [alpha proteobacterium AAP81b]|nr:hypothetical protein IP88_03385 [alpha proteobacterium AAP81b]